MRISFDLDDTLICYQPHVPCERRRIPFLLRHWFDEPLRRGTPELFHELTRRGWEIWIYTTSGRTERYMRWWLRFYGITLGGMVNEHSHGRLPMAHRVSKYPPAFQIDLHVDDSEGVRMEGEKHGFRVVVVSPEDPAWSARVLAAAAEAEESLNRVEDGHATSGERSAIRQDIGGGLTLIPEWACE
jgi:hypothetical protein